MKIRLSFVDNSITMALGNSKYLKTLEMLGFKNIGEAINHLEKMSKKYSASHYAENRTFKRLIKKYRKANTSSVTAKAPEIPGVDLKNKVYFDMQELSPELHCSTPVK